MLAKGSLVARELVYVGAAGQSLELLYELWRHAAECETFGLTEKELGQVSDGTKIVGYGASST